MTGKPKPTNEVAQPIAAAVATAPSSRRSVVMTAQVQSEKHAAEVATLISGRLFTATGSGDVNSRWNLDSKALAKFWMNLRNAIAREWRRLYMTRNKRRKCALRVSVRAVIVDVRLQKAEKAPAPAAGNSGPVELRDLRSTMTANVEEWGLNSFTGPSTVKDTAVHTVRLERNDRATPVVIEFSTRDCQSDHVVPHSAFQIIRSFELPSLLTVLTSNPFDVNLHFTASIVSRPTPDMVVAAVAQSCEVRKLLAVKDDDDLEGSLHSGTKTEASNKRTLPAERTAADEWQAVHVSSALWHLRCEVPGGWRIGDRETATARLSASAAGALSAAPASQKLITPVSAAEDLGFGVDLSSESDAVEGLAELSQNHPAVGESRGQFHWELERERRSSRELRSPELDRSGPLISQALVLRAQGRHLNRSRPGGFLSSQGLRTMLSRLGRATAGVEVVAAEVVAKGSKGRPLKVPLPTWFEVDTFPTGPTEPSHDDAPLVRHNRHELIVGRTALGLIVSEALTVCGWATRCHARTELPRWIRSTAGAPWAQSLETLHSANLQKIHCYFRDDCKAPDELLEALFRFKEDGTPMQLAYCSRRLLTCPDLPSGLGFVPVNIPKKVLDFAPGHPVYIAPFGQHFVTAAQRIAPTATVFISGSLVMIASPSGSFAPTFTVPLLNSAAVIQRKMHTKTHTPINSFTDIMAGHTVTSPGNHLLRNWCLQTAAPRFAPLFAGAALYAFGSGGTKIRPVLEILCDAAFRKL
jgi:hypothetical protein